MVKNGEQREPHFPFEYGDEVPVAEDESRLSNYVVEALENERVQKVIYFVLMYGPHIADALDVPIGIGNASEMGGNLANANPANPGGGARLASKQDIAKAMRQKSSPIALPGAPKTPLGRTLNTTAVFFSMLVVCLNGYWGVGIGAATCLGGAMFLTKECAAKAGELFKKLF